MKLSLIIFFLVGLNQIGIAQYQPKLKETNRKGDLYFYWGWNREQYSSSTIHFTGDYYDFTLKDVIAKDRPSEFSVNTYFNPTKFSIPQTNLRVGYFLSDNWDISFGMDHMKYVVQKGQEVEISGQINNAQSLYNGVYTNERIVIADGFLQFEHTDGLNYFSLVINRSNRLISSNKIDVRFLTGIGIGFLLPRTDVILLQQERNDSFHLSGYGLNAMTGLSITFFDKFFIRSELKGGYINMPGVRTTHFKSDKASQDFTFTQANVVFGGFINLNRK